MKQILLFFFCDRRILLSGIRSLHKKIKKVKKNRVNNGIENLQLLSKVFWNKDLITQESPILADVENIVFYWIIIINLF